MVVIIGFVTHRLINMIKSDYYLRDMQVLHIILSYMKVYVCFITNFQTFPLFIPFKYNRPSNIKCIPKFSNFNIDTPLARSLVELTTSLRYCVELTFPNQPLKTANTLNSLHMIMHHNGDWQIITSICCIVISKHDCQMLSLIKPVTNIAF